MGLPTEIYRHNDWANLTLLEFVKAQGPEVLDATVNGTYGNIRDTLAHIVGAQSRYVTRAKGEEPGPPMETKDLSIDDLIESAKKSGAALIDLSETVPLDETFRTKFQGGAEYDVRKSVVMVQAINHATEHRSQVMTILTQAGVQPPELDGWTYGDAAGHIKKA